MKKFNSSKIIHFFRKYKYFIVFIIVLILIILVPNPIREGLVSMSIGEYEFLEPVSTPYVWTQDKWSKYVKIANVTGCYGGTCNQKGDCIGGITNPLTGCLPSSAPSNFVLTKQLTSKQLQGWNKEIHNSKTNGMLAVFGMLKDITAKEVDYYLQNEKWPWCSYIENYINNHSDVLNQLDLSQYNFTTLTSKKDFLKKSFPNRTIYAMLLLEKESKMNPQPLSYKIFTDQEKPPSSSKPLSSLGNNNTYYQDFVSLCKKVTSSPISQSHSSTTDTSMF